MTLEAGALPETRINRGLWLGWMAGPVAWFGQMVVVYALADGACRGGGLLPLHLATAAGLTVSALGGWASRANWRRIPRDPGDPRQARERFMAVQGMLCSSLFSVVIVAQWITVFVLDPCPL